MSKNIIVVGSANVDFIMQLPRLPKKGESVAGGPFSQAFGGKGSNQALAARRAGGMVTPVFNLGGDSFAAAFLELYKKEGMDVMHVKTNPGLTCGVGIILVDANGDNAIATDLGANGVMSVEQVDAAEAAIADAALVMLQMEGPDAAIKRTIELADKHGVEVMLNFAPARATAIALSKAVNILVVNETEAGILSGMEVTGVTEAGRAAEKLSLNGHRLVIVTLGANGSMVWEEGRTMHHPAFKIEAVDATAAGDTYCGALAAALVEKRPLADAVRFASAAGALCASRMGAMPSIPLRNEIDAFLATGS